MSIVKYGRVQLTMRTSSQSRGPVGTSRQSTGLYRMHPTSPTLTSFNNVALRLARETKVSLLVRGRFAFQYRRSLPLLRRPHHTIYAVHIISTKGNWYEMQFSPTAHRFPVEKPWPLNMNRPTCADASCFRPSTEAPSDPPRTSGAWGGI